MTCGGPEGIVDVVDVVVMVVVGVLVDAIIVGVAVVDVTVGPCICDYGGADGERRPPGTIRAHMTIVPQLTHAHGQHAKQTRTCTARDDQSKQILLATMLICGLQLRGCLAIHTHGRPQNIWMDRPNTRARTRAVSTRVRASICTLSEIWLCLGCV